MTRSAWWIGVAFGVAVLAGSLPRANAAEAAPGALAAYVAKPDDSYHWAIRSERELGKTVATELILTSQTWRGIVWKHQVIILRPAKMTEAKDALMLISGGGWDEHFERPFDASKDRLPGELSVLSSVVAQLDAPVVLLNHVPFQPIFDGKVEDEIIAYTFDEYLKTGDPEWPLLLPMVKSAVRAMDAAQEFAQKEWGFGIKNFTVTGASKRGWTTWLTGAVDPRAKAIAPMVIDMLNTTKQMEHQLATWGEYSVQIEDYTKRGIQGKNQTPEGKALSAIVDPYSYRDALTQPKLLIMGTNDPYWTLDALNIYWDDLQGEKYILYVPNNVHGLNDFRRLVGSISALHKHMTGQMKLPQLSWKLAEAENKLTLNLSSDQPPREVVAWVATSPTKDFRPAKWSSFPVQTTADGYRYEMPVPATGFAAVFGEAVFGEEGAPYFLSTNVRIVGPTDVPASAGK